MADSGIFRINPLQTWQRDAILKAAQLLRDQFGNPPDDPQARAAHDGLLEVLDPARRTTRLQKELSEATRKGVAERAERRARERRAKERRTAQLGPPAGVPERRKTERRSGERRNRK
jgi:regulator of protease activity HflC (stomatin/prohibitin superfamily)